MKIAYMLLYEYWNGSTYCVDRLAFAGWTEDEANKLAASERESKLVKMADARIMIMEVEIPIED